MKQTMLGSYGPWAEGLFGETPGKLSFRNKRWQDLQQWKQAARIKVDELLAKPDMHYDGQARLIGRWIHDGLDIEELAWNLPYGPETRALLLKPQGAPSQLPGILALHDHGAVKYFGKRKIVRTTDEIHPFVRRHQEEYYGGVGWANELARRGYVVLVHDIFPFASRRILSADVPPHVVERMMTPPLDIREVKPEDALEATGHAYDVPEDERSEAIQVYNAFAAQHESIVAKSLFSAGLTWPGIFLAEDQYALDYLCSRPDVDSQRIGCCGLSGGGLRTDYLGGLDDRISCSVSVGFMSTWRDFARDVSYTHTWMLYIPLLPRFMDFPEILGLRAPLPALVQACSDDPLYTLSEVQRSGKILREVYQKANAPEAFLFSLHDGPHKFDVPMQKEAFNWLDRWLR